MASRRPLRSALLIAGIAAWRGTDNRSLSSVDRCGGAVFAAPRWLVWVAVTSNFAFGQPRLGASPSISQRMPK